MNKLDPNNLKLWDDLFDFLFACDSTPVEAEIDADLREAGIDVEPAFARMQEMIEQARARERLAAAPQRRVSMLSRFKDAAVSHVTDLRGAVQRLIEKTLKGDEQVAHFHKLDKVATDEDLRSMLHDLERLAHLKEAAGNGDEKAQ